VIAALLLAAAAAAAAPEPRRATDWQVTAWGHVQQAALGQHAGALKGFADAEAGDFVALFGGSASPAALTSPAAMGGGLAVDRRVAPRVVLGLRLDGALAFAFAAVDGDGDAGERIEEAWSDDFTVLPILVGGRWEFGDADDVTYGLGAFAGPVIGHGASAYRGTLTIPWLGYASATSASVTMRATGFALALTGEAALRLSRSFSLVAEAGYRRAELTNWKDAGGGPVTFQGEPLRVGFSGLTFALATRWHP